MCHAHLNMSHVSVELFYLSTNINSSLIDLTTASTTSCGSQAKGEVQKAKLKRRRAKLKYLYVFCFCVHRRVFQRDYSVRF